MMFCIVAHNITCYFYLLAKNEDIPIEETYVGNAELNDEQIYVKTLYYVITTISTVGFGDIGPTTSKEIAFVMFIQFLGVVIFAYLTGNITSILMNMNQREKILSEKEINLDKWFLDMNSHHRFKIAEDLQKNIKDYFMYYWENDHSSLLSETNFLMRMPIDLRNRFLDYLFFDEIQEFSVFFTDLDIQLKYQLMLSTYPRIIEEKTPAIKANTEVEEIFIIRRGKVLLTTTSKISFLILGEKSFIGEEFVLFNKVSKIDFIADEGGLECFCIKKGKYIELLNKFPNSFHTLLKRAFKRNKYFKAVMQSNISADDIGYNENSLIRSKTTKSGAAEYLENFSWELTNEESQELNELISKNNEITVKDKIVENIKNNKQSMNALQENVEKITTKVEQIKEFYERDMKNLVHVINLLKDGQNTEANHVLAQLKIAS